MCVSRNAASSSHVYAEQQTPTLASRVAVAALLPRSTDAALAPSARDNPAGFDRQLGALQRDDGDAPATIASALAPLSATAAASTRAAGRAAVRSAAGAHVHAGRGETALAAAALAGAAPRSVAPGDALPPLLAQATCAARPLTTLAAGAVRSLLALAAQRRRAVGPIAPQPAGARILRRIRFSWGAIAAPIMLPLSSGSTGRLDA
jgi:hypothetical protein